jgi:hypothetical protein
MKIDYWNSAPAAVVSAATTINPITWRRKSKCDKSNWMNGVVCIWTLHYRRLVTLKQNDLAESHAQSPFQQPTSCYCSSLVPMPCLCRAQHIVLARPYGCTYLVYSRTVQNINIFRTFSVIYIFSMWIGLNLHLKHIGYVQCLYLGRFNVPNECLRAHTLTLNVPLWLIYYILIFYNH